MISEEALDLRNANLTGDGIVVSARHKNKKLRARSKDSINIYGKLSHTDTLNTNRACIDCNVLDNLLYEVIFV